MGFLGGNSGTDSADQQGLQNDYSQMTASGGRHVDPKTSGTVNPNGSLNDAYVPENGNLNDPNNPMNNSSNSTIGNLLMQLLGGGG